MNIKDAIADYIDADGLVTTDYKPGVSSTGNGLLYLSLYIVQLVKQGLFTKDDYKRFCWTLDICSVPFNERYHYYGLYNRSPEKLGDQEGPDDYIGIAYASKLIKSPHARDIRSFGEDSGFLLIGNVYDNANPAKFYWKTAEAWKAWFGRFPWVIAHFQICSNKKPNIVRRLIWSVAMTFSGIRDKTDLSLRILDWFMIQGMKDSGSWLCRIGIKIWTWRFNRTFPRGMKQVIEGYFGAEHPLALYWQN